MVDVDEVVAGCIAAVAEDEPRLAVRELLQRALAEHSAGHGVVQETAGLTVLYRSDDLTIVDVIWPPRFSIFPHDHRMWAAIGIYGGREDNAFYRRSGPRLVESGGKELVEGDVALLGDDTIHAVRNPARSYTGAIHVYGGDFVGTPRSQWDAVTLEEEPYDLDGVRRAFEEAQQVERAEQAERLDRP